MKNTFLSTLILVAFLLNACSAGSTPTPTPAGQPQVETTDLSAVTAEGTLLPTPSVELAFAQGGVVAEVLVQPGDKVAAGDVLARLVGVEIAQADFAAAQSQYNQTYSAALAQEQSKRSQDWYKTQSGDFTLPLWYYDQQEQLEAAQVAVEKAQDALVEAREKLTAVGRTTGADFIKVESDLNAAQADYQVAKNLNNRVKNGKNIDELTRRQLYLLQRDAYLKSKGVEPKWVGDTINKDLRDEAQEIFDDAESVLKDAQDAYDDAASTDGAKDILKARAKLSVAQERYDTAQDYVRFLQTGSESQLVTGAAAALDKAKAAIELYELRAPFDGVVLSLDLAVGESVAPTMPTAFLADPSVWTVETKDLAEIDVAKIAIGDTVLVQLDAFPGEEFQGTVTAIDPVGREYLGDMTYKVTIALDGVDPRFLWNMTATVTIGGD